MARPIGHGYSSVRGKIVKRWVYEVAKATRTGDKVTWVGALGPMDLPDTSFAYGLRCSSKAPMKLS